ncbi:MAG: nucleoside triphosphate pyrophosphohydrolase [Lentisphaerae bacterium]|nr:nucleoside triphosphate pyrophosphohydrolase [Lentisphaerota bacterium]MBR2871897.1 nucleoside triphosphate pyrophosphohydrolase [Lentisphaeria bacterium]
MKEYPPTAGALMEILHKLRSPEGCPWDRAQTAESFGACFAGEAAELLDAIDRNDSAGIREECGDVLMNVLFQIVLAEEQGLFTIDDVWREIIDKMVRRHAHIFGDRKAETPEEVAALWQEMKSKEHKEKKAQSVLDDVKHYLSPLNRAEKLQKKAATYGFDWTMETDILEKIREELLETSMAMASGNEALVDEELGDLLFAVVNLIRFRKRANSEELLRKASLKFESRFRFIEKELQQTGRKLEDCSFEEMEALWLKAKNALSPTENSSDEK